MISLTEQMDEAIKDARDIKRQIKRKKDAHVFVWCAKCPYLDNCYDEYGGPYCLEPSCNQFKDEPCPMT